TSLHRYGGYNLKILGSDHGSYSDLILFTRIPKFLGGRKIVNPQRAFEIINDFTLAFFDRYLRHRQSPILDRGGFPGEIRYEAYPVSSAPSTGVAFLPSDVRTGRTLQ